MNALTRILMNAVRAYNAERLNKLTKLAEVGTEKRGAGVYAEKGNKNFLVFFVIDGVHQWECNYEVSSKTDASNIAQAFADGDVKVGSELDEMQDKHVAELLAPRNDAVAGPAETCDDSRGEDEMNDRDGDWPAVTRPVSYPTAAEMRRLAQEKADAQRESMDSECDVEHDVDDDLESGEVQDAGQLQGIDRHGDPFYDNLDDDILRECTNKDCGWVGKTDRMCGTTGPLCEDCGDTTEPQTAITAEDADIEGGIETLYASPREGMSFSHDFKLHPHQQKVVDYLNKNETDAAAFEAVVNNEVAADLVIDPVQAEVKKPKIERGRSAKRKAAKRKGNQKPRGSNAQPSLLLDKMFGRNPITLAE